MSTPVVGRIPGFNHHFHIVTPSPWPVLTAWALFGFLSSLVSFFQGYAHRGELVVYALMGVALILGCWWRDVIRESTYEEKHTVFVRRGLLLGVVLFIVSEVAFFGSFFWAFFHSSLVPASTLGGVWPPVYIETISPWGLPALNTLILLLSGATVTRAHHVLKAIRFYRDYVTLVYAAKMVLWLAVTVGLGVFFLLCQALEYHYAPFNITDGIYGTTFYVLTGFHGFHVLVGTIFLAICLWRAARLHFTATKQTGLKRAIWYWHFVDVVWIGLFASVYVWGCR